MPHIWGQYSFAVSVKNLEQQWYKPLECERTDVWPRRMIRVVGVVFFEGLSQHLHLTHDGFRGVSRAWPQVQNSFPSIIWSIFVFQTQIERKARLLEDAQQLLTGCTPEPSHHALKTADALRGRRHGRHQHVLLLQVRPTRQRRRRRQGGRLHTLLVSYAP